MTARLPLVLSFACLWAAGCQQDSVAPNQTGAATGQGGSTVMGGAGAAPPTNAPATAGSSSGSGATAGSTAGMSGGSASGGGGGGPNSGGAGAGGTMVANNNGVGGAPAMSGSGGSTGSGGSAPGGGPCDLSGRWLSTVHMVTDALGQKQTAHFFIYYEIARMGDALTVTKGLHCGDDARSNDTFAVEADFKPSWARERTDISYAGRTVTSVPGTSGCDVHFGKSYTVRGATVAYYLDPAHKMPTKDQGAAGAMPGWEDWDNDGKPGITGTLSGTVTGNVYVAPRHWTEFTGSVPNVMSSFRLPVNWDQEPNVMATNPCCGSEIDCNAGCCVGGCTLESEANVHPDTTLHFVQFARLADGQATGDDNAICDEIIKLAPMLTPEASAI